MVFLEVDGFEGLELLDRGGFGMVYRATRSSTGGVVAIKVLDPAQAGGDAELLERRLRREIAALVQLKGHPNVVQVEEVVSTPGGPGIVMEFMDGGTVVGPDTPPMSAVESAAVGAGIASALAAAHDVGIVHRDVKPKNMLKNSFGQVKLCDFGIAAIVKSSEFATRTTSLSVQYASPEELDEAPDIGPPTDVYSLGASLYHLWRGKPPSFRAGRSGEPVPTPDGGHPAPADARMAAFIDNCMQVEPALRPTAQSAQRALLDLANASGPPPPPVVIPPGSHTEVRPPPLPITGDPPPSVTPQTEPAGGTRRRRSLVLLSVILLVALGLGGLLLFAGGGAESDEGASDSVTAATGAAAIEDVAAAPSATVAATSPPTAPSVEETDPPATAATVTTAPPPTTSVPPPSTSPPPTAPPPTAPPPNPSLLALTSLNDQVAADSPVVAGILESWVPQLSAKQLGTPWEGVIYGYPEIWSEHQFLRSYYNVVLVEGGRYNFEIDGEQMAGWYITLVAEPFFSSDGALNWCRAAGIDRNNCAAKFISDIYGAEQSLVLQPR